MATPTLTALRPLGDRLVVKVVREEVTAGGIVLPAQAQEKPQQGEVIAVGPGRILNNGTRVPVEVAVGDKVLFAKYAGTDLTLTKEHPVVGFTNDTVVLLAEKDVLGVVS